MSDIFICYSSKDRTVADRLLARLQAEGWSVWMDKHVRAGAKWRKEIQTQRTAARCVVALWSAAAEASDYVIDEAEDAKSRGILIPALIESMKLPYGFRQAQSTTLVGWDGGADLRGPARSAGGIACAPERREPADGRRRGAGGAHGLPRRGPPRRNCVPEMPRYAFGRIQGWSGFTLVRPAP